MVSFVIEIECLLDRLGLEIMSAADGVVLVGCRVAFAHVVPKA